MTGTRIIYRRDARSVDVQLANRGNVPYIVQTWFDEGDMNDGPESKRNIPFVVSPASFCIAPNAGQVARISYTRSRALPEDRESIFYFNFQEIPPSNVGAMLPLARIKCWWCCATASNYFFAHPGWETLLPMFFQR